MPNFKDDRSRAIGGMIGIREIAPLHFMVYNVDTGDKLREHGTIFQRGKRLQFRSRREAYEKGILEFRKRFSQPDVMFLSGADVRSIVRYSYVHPLHQRTDYKWWTMRCPNCSEDRGQTKYVGGDKAWATSITCGSPICTYILGLVKKPMSSKWPPRK